MEEIARNVDRIVVMSHAHKLMDGTPEEVFSHAEALTAIGLSVPMPTRIAMELKAMGVPITHAIYTTSYLRKAILKLWKEGE